MAAQRAARETGERVAPMRRQDVARTSPPKAALLKRSKRLESKVQLERELDLPLK